MNRRGRISAPSFLSKGDQQTTRCEALASQRWRLDGVRRPDLEGAEEPDLPVTPFCNTLPIRRAPAVPSASLSLDTAFVGGPTLMAAWSRQRYYRQGAGGLHYVDLGLSRGFEANPIVDGEGVVLTYEYLFERVMPA